MIILPEAYSFYWEHPDFGLAGIYTQWCGFSSPPRPVQGSWVRDWVPGVLSRRAQEEALQRILSVGREVPQWVGTEQTASQLRGHGFTDVRVIGAPVVYISEPRIRRLEGSLLLLLSGGVDSGGEEERVNWQGAVDELLEGICVTEGDRARITLCLGADWYYAARKWIWRLRLARIKVILFEENPLKADSLKEAAIIFASVEFVAGNVPGHWMAHAALRGAKVSLLSGYVRKTGDGFTFPDGFTCDPLSAVEASEWARAELGFSERRSRAGLAEIFGWPLSLGGDESRVSQVAMSSVLELSPRQLFEEACAEQPAEAIEALLEAGYAKDLADSNVALPLALFRLSHGKYFQAARLLEHCTKGECLNVPSVILLVDIFIWQKRYNEAGELLRHAIEQNPDHPALFLSTGRLMQITADAEMAKRFFTIGLNLAREHASGLIWPQSSTGPGAGRMLMVSCSAKSEGQQDSLMIVQSFRKNLTGPGRKLDLDMMFSNAKGLPEVYNIKLEEAASLGYEFICFVHDDVHIDDSNLEAKVMRMFQDFGFHLIGIAGGSKPKIVYPTLWHRMCNPENYRGFVFNCSQYQHVVEVTRFGSSPASVELLDGVFLAVHVPSAMAVGWRFNESFRFHHYDLAGSIDAKRKGLNVGVAPIHIIHMSPGLADFADIEWTQSDALFLKQYGIEEGAES